jgi:alpha-L-fucosidase 2
MDVVICREALSNLLEALRVLEETDGQEERYRQLLAALPDYQINGEGGLQEWMHPDLEDVQNHRHLSHLYELFPGWAINQEDTPETYARAVRALELRQNELGSMAGWSFSFMANLWARSGNGERALENLDLLLRGCTTPNLLSWGNDWRAQGLSCFWGQGALPPFQIEAGMGFVSAVCEMLVRSRPGFLHLLPALPGAWHKGTRAGDHDPLRRHGGSVLVGERAGAFGGVAVSRSADDHAAASRPLQPPQPDPGAAVRQCLLSIPGVSRLTATTR